MSDEEAKPLSVFDFMNSINDKKYTPPSLNDTGYNQYVINKGLSYYPDTILLVDEINVQGISNQMHYEFLYHILDKRVRRSKWFKPESDENMNLIMEYFGLNTNKAKEILQLFSPEDFETIKAKLEKGG